MSPITVRNFEMLMAFRVVHGNEKAAELWRSRDAQGLVHYDFPVDGDFTITYAPADENEFEKLTAVLVARKLVK